MRHDAEMLERCAHALESIADSLKRLADAIPEGSIAICPHGSIGVTCHICMLRPE